MPARRPSHRLARITLLLSANYLFIVVLACMLIHYFSDRWWPATLLLLGPRWFFALPLAALIPMAGRWSRKSVWMLGVASFFTCFPLMGLTLHLPTAQTALRNPAGKSSSLRVLTCNAHTEALYPPALAQLCVTASPDVIAVEEWPYGPGRWGQIMPEWNAITLGELHIESPHPISDLRIIFGGHGELSGDAIGFSILTSAGTVPMIDTHTESPHDAISAVVHLQHLGPAMLRSNSMIRRSQAILLSQAARESGGDVIIMGDFNMPMDANIYQEDFTDLTDAFSAAGQGFGWTYFWRGTAVRIDHILVGRGWNVAACWVAESVGSPHRPLIAVLDRRGS